MKSRPWPLIILGLIQIAMPAFNLVINSLIYDVAIIEYFDAYVKVKGPLEIIDFFLLYPIAGIGIILMKKWSYPLFILVSCWTMSSNIYVWSTQSTPFISITALFAANLFNLAFVTYYLLPEVRRIYFQKQLRWWESKPRFLVDFNSQYIMEGTNFSTHIKDISEGGAFISTDSPLKKGDQIDLNLNLMELNFTVRGTVVHANENGAGIYFDHTRETRNQIKDLALKLRTEGYSLRHEPEGLLLSFSTWVTALINERKGLIP